jgi:hypothetical protein
MPKHVVGLSRLFISLYLIVVQLLVYMYMYGELWVFLNVLG